MRTFKDLRVGDKIECHRNWADDKYNGLVATIEVKNFLTIEDGILINYKQVTSNLIGRYMRVTSRYHMVLMSRYMITREISKEAEDHIS